MSLWLDDDVRLMLVMADKFGKPLFEMCPQIFPDGFMNDTEKLLWMHYFNHKAKVMSK